MARKSKKTGSYTNRGVRTAKKSSSTQVEWGAAAIDGASRWLLGFYRLYWLYENLKPWIEQHMLMLLG